MSGFTAENVPDQTGRVHFVTGANSGVGFETCKVLAMRGARVLLGCRSRERAEAAVSRIRLAAPDADLRIVDLDLGDLDSVRAAAEAIGDEPVLHTLVNNAGIMMVPLQRTTQGFEAHFGVNHLGPFLLTALLLPRLEASGTGRVVNTSSNGHRLGGIRLGDLNAHQTYSRIGRYCDSKLANLLHGYELARRLRTRGSHVRAITVHPGGSATELFRHLPGWMGGFVGLFAGRVLNTAAAGAWPTLLGATHPDAESGAYYGPSGWFEVAGPAVRVTSNALSHDPTLAAQLWDASMELTSAPPHP